MALVRFLLAAVLCFMLAACERMPTNSESGAPLSMQIRLPDSWHANTAQTVTVLAVRVTGPLMPPVVSKIRLLSDSTATRTRVDTLPVIVPVGPHRRFEAFLLDVTDAAAVIVQAYADTILDIPRGDGPIRLSMTLGPPPPPPIVRIITSHGLPGLRDPVTFFSEWAKRQVEPLGYQLEYQDTGFNPIGADLVVVPMPNADFPYTSAEGDVLLQYLQLHGGSVLFLGEAGFAGSMTPLTNWYGFYFAGTVSDTVQFNAVFEAPIVTDFGAAHFLTEGDTLIYAGGLECARFDTLIPVVIDTLAKLSPDGLSSTDVIRFVPPAVALYGRIGAGQFVAVGDMDWIGPTTLVPVGGANTLVASGLQVKQHAKLARLLLQRLAPPDFLTIP